MDVILAGLVGAMVAGAFALGGAIISNRREHERWLRQQRLDAYRALLAAANDVQWLARSTRVLTGEDHACITFEEISSLTKQVHDSVAATAIVGPRSIQAHAATLAQAAIHAAMNPSDAAIAKAHTEARAGFARSAAEVLGTND